MHETCEFRDPRNGQEDLGHGVPFFPFTHFAPARQAPSVRRGGGGHGRADVAPLAATAPPAEPPHAKPDSRQIWHNRPRFGCRCAKSGQRWLTAGLLTEQVFNNKIKHLRLLAYCWLTLGATPKPLISLRKTPVFEGAGLLLKGYVPAGARTRTRICARVCGRPRALRSLLFLAKSKPAT